MRGNCPQHNLSCTELLSLNIYAILFCLPISCLRNTSFVIFSDGLMHSDVYFEQHKTDVGKLYSIL